MWIIPNNLQLSSGAPDTAGFISDLNEQSQICASSLMVRSKPSRSQTWSQKWKRDSWTALLSGRILRPSHAKPFETEWTCLWPVIPANPSARQESGSEQKTLATSGRTSPDQYELFAPECVFSRTSKDTSPSDSERSLENWNQLVTRRRGEYSLRGKLEHHTRGNECSSWPSPIASEVRQGFQDRSRGMKGSQESLTTVVMKSWPTPDASNHRDGAVLRTDNNLEQGGFHGVSLHHAMTKYGQAAPVNPSTNGSHQESWRTPSSSDGEGGVMEMREGCAGKYKLRDHVAAEEEKSWATPQSRDAKGAEGRMIREGQHTDLPSQTEVQATGTWNRNNGKLNPRWVETLMGLPVGWTMPSCASPVTIELTSCASSATESFQPPQSEHSEF